MLFINVLWILLTSFAIVESFYGKANPKNQRNYDVIQGDGRDSSYSSRGYSRPQRYDFHHHHHHHHNRRSGIVSNKLTTGVAFAVILLFTNLLSASLVGIAKSHFPTKPNVIFLKKNPIFDKDYCDYDRMEKTRRSDYLDFLHHDSEDRFLHWDLQHLICRFQKYLYKY
ncbi:Uncharacterised protein g4346 [Pycnogonum litorale]